MYMKKKKAIGKRNNFRGDKNIFTRDEAAAGRKLKAARPVSTSPAIAFNSCSIASIGIADKEHRKFIRLSDEPF